MPNTSTPPLHTFDPRLVADCLKQGEDRIWHVTGRDRNMEVSYPEEGNASCFEIEENSFWFRHRAKAISAALKSFPPSGAVFDVGGGNGYVTRFLLNAGYEAVLIEPGETGAANGISRGIPTVICATLTEARFRENSLPAVGLFDVLEHVEADREFLSEIYRCLVPGGRFYVTVPAYSWLWSYEDVTAGHFRRYTNARLAQDLQKAGFKCLYQTYIFSLLPIPLFLVRALPSLFGRIRFSASSEKKAHQPRMKSFTDRIWAAEMNLINNKGRIPFGSSCLMVAEKPQKPSS